MSAKVRNPGQKTLSIPENPHWLDFERSDGDPSTWPSGSRTERVVDSDGHVNFLRLVDPDELHGIRWRLELASVLAHQMNLPGKYMSFVAEPPDAKCRLDFQRGQIMFSGRGQLVIGCTITTKAHKMNLVMTCTSSVRDPPCACCGHS
jgi:hypothetical protein